MNNQIEKESNRRQFDWGPPANSFFDQIREWLVYFLFVILLGLGAWFFVDIRNLPGRTKEQEIIPSSKSEVAPTPVANANKNLIQTGSTSFKNYQVQLGAFADRKSAQAAVEELQNHGFVPQLSEPDADFEIYRIAIGPFNSETEAERIVEKLNSLDFHSFVVEFE